MQPRVLSHRLENYLKSVVFIVFRLLPLLIKLKRPPSFELLDEIADLLALDVSPMYPIGMGGNLREYLILRVVKSHVQMVGPKNFMVG